MSPTNETATTDNTKKEEFKIGNLIAEDDSDSRWNENAEKFFNKAIRYIDSSYKLNYYQSSSHSASVRSFFSSASYRKDSENSVNIFSTFRGYTATVKPQDSKYESVVYGIGIRAVGSSIIEKEQLKVSGKIRGFAQAAAAKELHNAETSRLVEIIGLPKFSVQKDYCGKGSTIVTMPTSVDGDLNGEFVYSYLPALLTQVRCYIEKQIDEIDGNGKNANIQPSIIQTYPKLLYGEEVASFIFALVQVAHGATLEKAKERLDNSRKKPTGIIDMELSHTTLEQVYNLIEKDGNNHPTYDYRVKAQRILNWHTSRWVIWPWDESIYLFKKEPQ